MNQSRERNWALITGASSGIGEAFAKHFAQEGWNVVLIARSLDKLNLLADSLKKANSVETMVMQADLSLPKAPHEIYEEIKAREIHVHALVNNAGFGAVGPFTQIDVSRQLEMIDVNVKALLALTHLFLPLMIERKSGFVINVSSTASFQPVPYLATYAATKAFVTIFSEALWSECHGTGVKIINLCPGRTKTNFGVVASQKESVNDIRPTQTSEEVVNFAFRAMHGRKPTLVTNSFDNALRFMERFVSRKWVALIARQLTRRTGYC